MKTTYRTPETEAAAALRLSRTIDAVNGRKLQTFDKVMRENRGTLALFSYYGPADDGLERKNPLIVALGDSVTAGHFERIGDMEEMFRKADAGLLEENEAIEVTDARVCYLEQFRSKLIDRYEQTSVSTINSGIAGDTLIGMQKRLYRDVIRYQPDLVILNGSLNWGPQCGSNEVYRTILKEIVCSLKQETKAEIVLLTPNMSIVPETPDAFTNPESLLEDRVTIIRQIAETEQVYLADAYKVWEAYQAEGYSVEALLANGMNHPSVTGHELYANVLMQLL